MAFWPLTSSFSDRPPWIKYALTKDSSHWKNNICYVMIFLKKDLFGFSRRNLKIQPLFFWMKEKRSILNSLKNLKLRSISFGHTQIGGNVYNCYHKYFLVVVSVSIMAYNYYFLGKYSTQWFWNTDWLRLLQFFQSLCKFPYRIPNQDQKKSKVCLEGTRDDFK